MLKRRVANPPLRTIEKIADALKISLVDLLSPPPPKKRRRAQSSYHDHIDAIGEVLLEHWQKSGMPKRTFAVSIGLSVPQFYKIMGGTASFLILGLAGLAERLNISLAELLGEEAS